ncbi:unnamed protein product [Schistosoma turkestanicum]|nr:unnamed protein product [Schistosoma turkestanicum]
MFGGQKKSQSVRKNALMIRRRRASSSFSRKSDSEKRLSRPTIRLIDENGVDLTPLPLLSEEKRIHEEKEISSTDFSQLSYHGGSSLHITNPFTFTRSYISGSTPFGESPSETSDEHDRYQIFNEVKTLAQTEQEILTEDDLNKLIDVIITETETFWIFDQPPKFVAEDSIQSEEQIKRNENYKTLIASKIGSVRFIERGMMTFSLPLINKLIQTEQIDVQNKSCMATNWDMVDTYEEEQAKHDNEQENKEAELKLLEDNDEINSHRKKSQTDLNKNQFGHQNDSGLLENTQPLLIDSLTGRKMETSQGLESFHNLRSETLNTNTESDYTFLQNNIITPVNQLTDALGLLETPKMKKDLNFMERALNLNIYHEQLIKYQSLILKQYQSNLDSSDSLVKSSPEMNQTLPNQTLNMDDSTGNDTPTSPLPTENSTTTTDSNHHNPPAKEENNPPTIPRVVQLWRFLCSMTKGYSITDMAWNKQNLNILAVGYGQFEYNNQQKGLVCCWSLKLIEHPERCYKTPNSVTAVGWSKFHPNLLAVGMSNGVVFVYDVQKDDQLPVIDTTYASGRHLGPIRKLQWIPKESGSEENLQEVLVSVSNDGRITQWFIRKGFESADLMVLKQAYSNVLTPRKAAQRNEALISRTAFATSMAFNKRESSIYVVGTESGPIYKCSYSYNEQYLDTYSGHTASVYQIEWSPFVSEIFLSCSADMTMRLWHSDHQKPLVTIERNMTTVPSISWSSHNSLIFAAVAEGVLEIWDLDHSIVDPFILETISTESNMTSVLFSETSQSVLIGDDQGTIYVFNLEDFPHPLTTKSEQASQLNQFLKSCSTNPS